ncbi:MAG TPA: hypothetical protein VGL82_08950 [Bryobacteraceae bacterium]
MKANKFTRFYNFLANLGLIIRDDPPRVIDLTGRVWGAPADGLVLSIRELNREDAGQVAGISVVMKNEGAHKRSLTVPPWIFFYRIEGLEPTPYGRKLMTSDRTEKDAEVVLEAGGAVETELPLATMYDVRAGNFRFSVSCTLPDQTILRSNHLMIRV